VSEPTKAEEIRNKTRATVTNEATGNTYLIHYFDSVDAFRIGGLPSFIDDDGNEKLEGELSPDERDRLELEFSERVVEHCCLEPKFTRDSRKAIDGVLHVSEVGDEVMWLASQILERWVEKLGKVVTTPKSEETRPPLSS